MGRAMGRGSKRVAVVTHQGTQGRKNHSVPKGIRGTKRHKNEARLSRSQGPSEEGHTFNNAKVNTKKAAAEEFLKHKMPFPLMSKSRKMKNLVKLLRQQAASNRPSKPKASPAKEAPPAK